MTNDEMLELCDRIEAMADELWDSNRLEYSHYFDLTAEIEHISNILKPKKTNGDRLREMNDEELAKELTDIMYRSFYNLPFTYLTYDKVKEANLSWLQKGCERKNDEL